MHPGVVHFDLKPPNVLVEVFSGGNVNCVICDFGYANVVTGNVQNLDSSVVSGLRRPHNAGITVAYSSPEVSGLRHTPLLITSSFFRESLLEGKFWHIHHAMCWHD